MSNEKKKRLKKDYIIISKTDIAYIQNFIIESAVFVAQMDADTAFLNLSINEMQKILKKIRKNKKKNLYLFKFKNNSNMSFILPTANLMTKKYCSSYRNDHTNEAIDSTSIYSRLEAAKYFAKRKSLPLKEYLKIFKVSK